MKQTIHIHNPRTAGMAMQSWGRRHAPSHQPLYRHSRPYTPGGGWTPKFDPSVAWTYLGHSMAGDLMDGGVFTREWYDGCFKFVFVRNTWSRLVSFYEFLRSEPRRMERRPEGKHLVDFGTFIRHLVSDEGSWPRFRFRQLPWLRWGVDFVGRFEVLDEDWRRLCEAISVKHRPLRRQGIRMSESPRDYRRYYNGKLRDAVAGYYADEIGRFDFEFD